MADRRLLALRHAKSSWEFDLPDHDRPLSARGRRDAEALGRYLRDHDLQPDLVICSSATRTRQTWAQAQSGGIEAGAVDFRRGVYAAWVPELLDIVRQVPADVGTLLLIGHAPGIPDLVEFCCRRAMTPAWNRMSAKFPTCGLAQVDVSGPWSELGQGRSALLEFTVPRA